ncbi:hypothetical protein LINPERHAP2_LOCUS44221, partial [Linum perenne]
MVLCNSSRETESGNSTKCDKEPEPLKLVPEDSEPIWSRGAPKRSFEKALGIKHSFRRVMSRVSDHVGDPRIGPMLLLGA